MKKLLYYLDRRSRGGAQRVMTSLASYFADNELSNEKYEVVLACQLPAPDRPCPISENVREIILPPASKNRLKRQSDRIRQLSELCKKEQPDIIISFLIGTNIIAIQTGRRLGIPVLISVRNDPEHDGDIFAGILIKRYYPKASGCVFQTKEAQEYFRFRYPTDVIMNPLVIDMDKFRREQRQNERAGIISEGCPESGQNEPTRIISVGRLEPQKRHDLTIRAFARIHKKHPNVTLTIFGQGPLEMGLRQLAGSLFVQDDVVFAGITEDIAGELLKFDIFVLSSDYEGMPNALMEAMAAGLCCISTDCPCGGPSTLIEDGINGFLCRPNDEEELSDKLEYVLSHPDIAKAVGQKASDIADTCRIDAVARQWRQMFDLCLTRKA